MILCLLKSCEAEKRRFEVFSIRFSLILSSHIQSATGSVVVTATCGTSPLSQITPKTKKLCRRCTRIGDVKLELSETWSLALHPAHMVRDAGPREIEEQDARIEREICE